MQEMTADNDENFLLVVSGIGLAVFLVVGLAVGVIGGAQGGPQWVPKALGFVALAWGALLGRSMVRAVAPPMEVVVAPSALSRWLFARRT